MSDTNSSDDVDRIERTDIGTSMEARLKRGSGTRDSDEVRIKAKGETAEETIDEFRTLLNEYEENLAQRLRDINPERADAATDEPAEF